MDRIEFFHNINKDANERIIQVLVNYFDQFMGLYDMFGNYEYNATVELVQQGNDGVDYIILDIGFYNIESSQIKSIMSISEPKIINLYNRQFTIIPLDYKIDNAQCNGSSQTKHVLTVKISG